MLNNTEILKVAEVVSQEKGIEMDIVMEALYQNNLLFVIWILAIYLICR